MNKVITKEVLAGQLPADLRGDIDPARRVRVTVEEVDAVRSVSESWNAARTLRDFEGVAGDRRVTIEEAVARVRALRDEWD